MGADGSVKIPISKHAVSLPAGLYVVATPIGNLKDITHRALEVLQAADAIACEDTRVTNRLLSHHGIKASMVAYNDANGEKVRPQLLRRMEEGQSIALVSDAGTPLISDPGYKLVKEARERGIYVTTLPGASSVMAALTLAGLPTNRFLFEGFLPVKQVARKDALQTLAAIPATLVFFERASRVPEVFKDMLEVLGNREGALVREISKTFEKTVRGTLAELTARYTNDDDIKGEVVLVIGPPSDEVKLEKNDGALEDRLKHLMQEHSIKDAAALAAAEFNIPRKLAYQKALELKNEGAGR